MRTPELILETKQDLINFIKSDIKCTVSYPVKSNWIIDLICQLKNESIENGYSSTVYNSDVYTVIGQILELRLPPHANPFGIGDNPNMDHNISWLVYFNQQYAYPVWMESIGFYPLTQDLVENNIGRKLKTSSGTEAKIRLVNGKPYPMIKNSSKKYLSTHNNWGDQTWVKFID